MNKTLINSKIRQTSGYMKLNKRWNNSRVILTKDSKQLNSENIDYKNGQGRYNEYDLKWKKNDVKVRNNDLQQSQKMLNKKNIRYEVMIVSIQDVQDVSYGQNGQNIQNKQQKNSGKIKKNLKICNNDGCRPLQQKYQNADELNSELRQVWQQQVYNRLLQIWRQLDVNNLGYINSNNLNIANINDQVKYLLGSIFNNIKYHAITYDIQSFLKSSQKIIHALQKNQIHTFINIKPYQMHQSIHHHQSQQLHKLDQLTQKIERYIHQNNLEPQHHLSLHFQQLLKYLTS